MKSPSGQWQPFLTILLYQDHVLFGHKLWLSPQETHVIPLVWHQAKLTQAQESSFTWTQHPPPRQEGGKGELGFAHGHIR